MQKIQKKLSFVFNSDLSFLKIKKKITKEIRQTLISLFTTFKGESIFLVKSLTIFCLISTVTIHQSHSQLLKKLGKKIEEKVEQRADRKLDKTVDKALDATEKAVDNSFQENTTGDETVKEIETNAANPIPAPTTTDLANGLVMVGGDCSDFIWFKEGSIMKFEVKDGKGKSVNQSKMMVNKVSKQSDATVADIDMEDENKNNFTMQFKCAGDKLYMDFASAIEQAMAKSNTGNKNETKKAGENIQMGFSDGFMSFPKNMYPGQKLDDAVFTMKTNSSDMGMNITTSLIDRKVMAKEKVTTPAGTFDCVKVTGTRKTTMIVLGKERNMGKPLQEHVWIAPGIGTIKQEIYTEKGNLESMSHLIEFKM